MKSLLTLSLLFVTIISIGQNNQYQPVKVHFTGVYDRGNNIITDDLQNRAWESLGKPDKTGYEFIANEVDGFILVGLVEKGDKVSGATVTFENGSIVQTRWAKLYLTEETIKKCREVAIKNGLKKDETDFGLFKFNKGGVIWYELGGTIDGEYGHIFIDEKFNFVSKSVFQH